MQLQPDVPGNKSPNTIMSKAEMLVLTEHYCKVRRCTSSEQQATALKGWDERDKRLVTSLYERLRHNGFYVCGVDAAGKLMFAYRMKGRLQQLMEQEGAKYEQIGQEILARCRAGEGVLHEVGE